MTWKKYPETRPDSAGFYLVITRFCPWHEETRAPISGPIKQIEYFQWKKTMVLEDDYVDRCVYRKSMAFFNDYGDEMTKNHVLYWYELDPIPEENE